MIGKWTVTSPIYKTKHQLLLKIWSELFPIINESRLNMNFWLCQSVFVERGVVYAVSNLWYACTLFKHIRRKSFLTSPNRRINVTEIKTAPHATTRLSRKIGSAWQKQQHYPILSGSSSISMWLSKYRLTHDFSCTSMAIALQIRRVQSNKCWFLTTGNIFAVMTKHKFRQSDSITVLCPFHKN